MIEEKDPGIDVATLGAVAMVDSDTHVTEPPDLWLSRLPSKWQDIAPQVRLNEATAMNRWCVGDQWLVPVGNHSFAGWKMFGPTPPPTFADIDPACWDPPRRLRRMDEYGIYAQILYPNIVGFEAFTFMMQADQEFASACIGAYNDYVARRPGSYRAHRGVGVAFTRALVIGSADASNAQEAMS